jgi:hypothetical protein
MMSNCVAQIKIQNHCTYHKSLFLFFQQSRLILRQRVHFPNVSSYIVSEKNVNGFLNDTR